MFLVVFFFAIMVTVLVAAGHSHYRYRVRNNRYYEYLFAADPLVKAQLVSHTQPVYNAYAFPALMVAIALLFLPFSLSI